MMRIPILAVIVLMLVLPSVSFSQLVPPERIEPAGPPLFVVTVKGKAGFMDPEGKIVIKPAFEQALPFHDGLAAVLQQGQWGYIDTTGRIVIEPQFVSVGSFSEGLAKFQDKRHADKMGYIDKQGQVVIQPQFDVAEEFRNGIARVGVATYKGILLSLIADVGVECHYKFIDRTGNRVPEPSPEHYATGEQDELIPYRKNNLYGYMNAEGQVVIEPQFDYAAPFSEGLARAYKNRLSGYIDKRGEWAIPPRFEYANDFSEGLAGVKLGEEGWAFIDRSGQPVIPGRYGCIYGGFRHGIAEVAFDRKQAYINKKGEWIRPLGE